MVYERQGLRLWYNMLSYLSSTRHMSRGLAFAGYNGMAYTIHGGRRTIDGRQDAQVHKRLDQWRLWLGCLRLLGVACWPQLQRWVGGTYEGYYAYFWSSAESNSDYAYNVNLRYLSATAFLDDSRKYDWFPVRCVKD